MRCEVINDTITPGRIHVRNIYDHEIALAESFVRKYTKLDNQEICRCPVSGENRDNVFFEKWGVSYSLCPKTYTLSLSYGVDLAVVNDYYSNSKLAAFRAEDSYQKMIGETREAIFQELLDWIEIRLIRYRSPYGNHVIDHKTKFNAWVDWLKKANFIGSIEHKDPYPYIDGNKSTGEADVVLAIDSLQSCLNLELVFNDFYDSLKPKGLVFLATRNGAGMDVLSLQGDNNTIYPYEHLTLLSPEGLKVLADKMGFEVLEISTPGLLDCEFVYSHIQGGKSTNPFLDYLFTRRDVNTRQSFQSFLQTNNLSSHLRAVLRKK